MSGRRNGLRKQVTEAKEGFLELRRGKGKGNMPGGKKRGRGRAVACSRRACPLGSLSLGLLRGEILREFPAEDINR